MENKLGIPCRIEQGKIKTEKPLEPKTKYVFALTLSIEGTETGLLFPVRDQKAYIKKCIEKGYRDVRYIGKTNHQGVLVEGFDIFSPPKPKKKKEEGMEIKYYRKMKNVDRLSGTAKHRSYNLLEHSYMVAMLFKHFASKENVAYTMAEFDLVLHHDILEVETGDLIYTVKNLNSETKECWGRIEELVIEKNFQLQRYSDENIKSGLSNLQYSLFKCCDLLDLWIFCKEEIALGNNTINMLIITERCVELIGDKFKSIKKFMEGYEA